MYSVKVVGEASKKLFNMANWNNFVNEFMAAYPNAPKNYHWMRTYNNSTAEDFFADWVTDVALNYTNDPAKAVGLSFLLTIGVSASILTGESIEEILQHISEVVNC